MSILEFSLLFGAVLVGGAVGLRFPELRGRYLHLVLSFSGAYLLSITALHLIPEAFAFHKTASPGLAILAGFFLQVLFEQFSQGVEHGHMHVHEGQRLALPVLIGLSLHAFLEGSPLSILNEIQHVGHEHNQLLTGLILHKIPAGFALSVLLAHAGYQRLTIWLLLVLFACMSPLGAVVAAQVIDPAHIPYVLGLVIGSLLHVSTTILFELDDQDHHRLTWVKTTAIAVGIIVALITTYL